MYEDLINVCKGCIEIGIRCKLGLKVCVYGY